MEIFQFSRLLYYYKIITFQRKNKIRTIKWSEELVCLRENSITYRMSNRKPLLSSQVAENRVMVRCVDKLISNELIFFSQARRQKKSTLSWINFLFTLNMIYLIKKTFLSNKKLRQVKKLLQLSYFYCSVEIIVLQLFSTSIYQRDTYQLYHTENIINIQRFFTNISLLHITDFNLIFSPTKLYFLIEIEELFFQFQ